MKFRELFSRRKIWIPILIIILVIAVILVVVLINKSHRSPDSGKAAFYDYPANICDSLTELLTEEQKAMSLLYYGNTCDSITELSKMSNVFSGYCYLELNDLDIFKKFSNQKNDKKFIRAINEDLLQSLSNDSLLFVSTDLINTINDSVILNRYYSYQTELLIKNNINALIINLLMPEILDSVTVKLISDRLLIELKILHQNNILSIIKLDDFSGIKNPEYKKQAESLFIRLRDAGICGVIVSKQDQLQIFEDLDFDGIVFLILKNEIIPNENLIRSVDAYIVESESQSYLNDLAGQIKKHNKKENLFLKSSKILRAGLWANQIHQTEDSVSVVFNVKLLESNITEASITVMKNTDNLIPIIDIKQRFHLLIATETNAGEFINSVSKYISNYTISYYDLKSGKSPAIPSSANTLIVLYQTGIADSIPANLRESVAKFNNRKIFINCGKISSELCGIESDAIVQIYNTNSTAFSFAAQLVFGGIGAQGTLAVTLNDSISYGYGIKTAKTRLKYSMPEDAGLNPEILLNIDSIINYAISTGAFPGCQVFIAKSGVVVFDKSYGYHDYSKTNPVKRTDIYDLASLTKICATTLAMMKMVETGKIKLDDKLEEYFKNTEINYGNIKPDTLIFIDTVSIAGKSLFEIKELIQNKDTIHINDTLVQLTQIVYTRTTPLNNIFQVPVRALLVHQSGICPSLPILKYMFYQDSYKEYLSEQKRKNDSLSNDSVSKDVIIVSREEAFDFYFSKRWVKDSAEVKIAENMYLKKRWQDTLYEDVKRLGTFNRDVYQYTDMNMILVQAIIDTVNKKSLDVFVKEEFYKDLGMVNTTFLPLECNIPRNRIAPTENETYWRKQVIHGTVHDPSAAMLGGVSGNAGLFSSASDLGILGQMWLNGGVYGGKRYLNQATIKMFSATQPENHRGLGFDKAAIKNLNAPSAPATTYGHTGFTGCVMWIDPENEIVYVFLSNRLHPNVKNWQILGQKVLQNVHQVVYDAIIQ
jgi:CubicO group peptidase (beta-lactamase class C family)